MKKASYVLALLPFWLYVLFFKFGAGLHYSLLSTLGSRVLPVWAVGLAVGGAALLQMILDVPAGYALDRVGYVRLLRICTFVFALGAATLFFGLTPLTFFATLLLSEVGWLFFGPGTSAYVLSKVSKDVAGRSLGFFHAVSSGGTVLATAALPFMVQAAPPVVGGLLVALLVIAWFLILRTPPERTTVHEERKVKRHEYYVRRTFLPRLLQAIRKLNPASGLLILHNFASCLFYGAIWFVVPLVLAQDVGKSMSGISLSIFDLAVVLLGSFLGTLADRYDRRRLIFFGLLLFATSGAILGFHFNLWFLLFGFLATAGDEMSLVSLWSWLDHLDSTHEEDGLVNGALVVFEDLGWAVGPVAAGLLYVTVGPSWTIAACAVPILLAWLFATIFLRRYPSSPIPASSHIPRRPRHKS